MPVEYLPTPEELDSRASQVLKYLNERGVEFQQANDAIRYLLFYSPDEQEMDLAFAQAKRWDPLREILKGGPSEFIGLASFLSRHSSSTTKCHDHNPPVEVVVKLEGNQLVYECTGSPTHRVVVAS